MIQTSSNHKNTDGLAVLMSVYQKDRPQWLDEAIASIVRQTKQSDEIVLVKDGLLTSQLNGVVDRWVEKYPNLFKIVALEKNNGLGPALTTGIKNCSCEIIARMDADDLSTPDRFQKQFTFLRTHPEIDLVCSWADQFETNPSLTMFSRKTPNKHREIARLAKFRNPINHGTVMYRRSKVLAVGGYHNIEGFEDYHLWVRMLINGARMACLPKVLYKFRRNPNMLNRRRGLPYLWMFLKLEKKFLNMHFLSLTDFIINIFIRTCAYLIPVRILRRIRTLLRV